MDIGTISIILLAGMLMLLAIGMPLGFASGFLAVVVMVLKFEPQLLTAPWTFGEGILTRNFGSGPMNILAQRLYGITTNYVLISVPLFIFMATLLERDDLDVSERGGATHCGAVRRQGMGPSWRVVGLALPHGHRL